MVSATGSPSTSRMPAGISMTSRSYGGRYWRTRTTDALPSASNCNGTAATAPGERTMSRSNSRTVRCPERPDGDVPHVPLVDQPVAEVAELAGHATL